jgi:hypothetical protein
MLLTPKPIPKYDENVWAAPTSPKAFMTVKRYCEENLKTPPAINDLRHQIEKRVKFAIDSGCTQSIVSNKTLLSDYSTCHVKMSTANSGTMHCPLVGTLRIGDLILKNCLYSTTQHKFVVRISTMRNALCCLFRQKKLCY